MLLLLNEVFKLEVPRKELLSLSAQLGSDCPYFVYNVPSIVTGRGEVIQPIDKHFLTGYYITVIHSGIHISTKEAFSRITPKPINFHWQLIIDDFKNNHHLLSNDFEPFAISTYPLLKEIKEQLQSSGAFFTQMTGSGSAIYGISEKVLDVSYYSQQKGFTIFQSQL
jgi:4-diphosphocytidyl-2-C-methyl-D-erythritol kinase